MAQEKWLVDGAKTIDIGMVRRLKVALVGGKVDIIGHDEPTARVEVHSVSGKELLVSLDGDTLEIDHPQLGWENFIDVFRWFKGSERAEVSIMVPRDVALTLGVVSASALVSGLGEDATISTVNGDVVVDGVTGDIHINGVNGEIAVRNHTGAISARTISGDVTASGAISRVGVDTVSGEVFLDIAGTPDSVRANTVSGAITTRLQQHVATKYTINTVTGRLQLDDSEITGVRGGYTGRFGDLDRNWLEFKANTVSGNISVLHSVTV